MHPLYFIDRFQNLSGLRRAGYSTWYPEVRFSTGKGDVFEITDLHASGIDLGSITYGGGIERHYFHKVKELKTQVNHSIRLNQVSISPHIFGRVIRAVQKKNTIFQPYIANLTVGLEHFADDRIPGFRTVSFDHVVTGKRHFCTCHYDAHATMLLDAKTKLPNFVFGSWPHRVVSLLDGATYVDRICHFCVVESHGKNAHFDWYGSQIRSHFQPYIDVLIRGNGMDRRTARAEVMRRLSISRWVREDQLYELIRKLFPKHTIRREASPSWLGRQRLDIFLPELALSIEYQGEQHFLPIEAFGGSKALEKTRERDQRKRSLCRENGVTVIEVRYDDPLTMNSLRNRLRNWLR